MKNAEFVMTPLIAAALFGADPRVVLFLFGCLCWTLIEYATHRTLHALRVAAHFHHHQQPQEPPPSFFVPFWLGLALSLWLAPMALTGGLVAGYAWFINVHHCCHFDHDEVDSALLAHHDGHHGTSRGNFGVSTRLWDRLFGTTA